MNDRRRIQTGGRLSWGRFSSLFYATHITSCVSTDGKLLTNHHEKGKEE